MKDDNVIGIAVDNTNKNLLDRDAIKARAQQEIKEEIEKKATAKLKELYRQLEDANKVVRNIQREIDDYLIQLEE